ncbi:hypothetical protein DPMN_069285 [Dreissena polymorpha]|uniref:Uncharacterized protein n=1 Tax=Dreissena polymorpha TaxID=45954 RepID=A0A9D4BU79_DREPO|nr:hypothetical protein DPMN_069285 [Dreissena polymorpha]
MILLHLTKSACRLHTGPRGVLLAHSELLASQRISGLAAIPDTIAGDDSLRGVHVNV